MSSLQQGMAACSTCPKMCRHVCPTAQGSVRESRTPSAKSTMGHLWESGLLELDDDVRQAFYDCCHCGLCLTHCEVEGVHLIAQTRHLRARLVEQGAAHPAVLDWAAFVAESGVLPGVSRDVLAHHAQPDAGARSLILMGMAAARWDADVIAAVLAQAAQRGEAVATLGGAETPTGGEAWDLGLEELAKQQAQALADQLNEGPWERIICLDPADALMLMHGWPLLGVTLTKAVVALPIWLAENPVYFVETWERVAFHDPAPLARGLEETEAPRALIRAAGAELVEPLYHGREGRCCGGDGGLPVTNPALADAITAESARELLRLGVDRVLTACPTCTGRLRLALGDALPVEDLSVWMLRHIHSEG
jgi:Fe-S oxidoreductase